MAVAAEEASTAVVEAAVAVAPMVAAVVVVVIAKNRSSNQRAERLSSAFSYFNGSDSLLSIPSNRNHPQRP